MNHTYPFDLLHFAKATVVVVKLTMAPVFKVKLELDLEPWQLCKHIITGVKNE